MAEPNDPTPMQEVRIRGGLPRPRRQRNPLKVVFIAAWVAAGFGVVTAGFGVAFLLLR